MASNPLFQHQSGAGASAQSDFFSRFQQFRQSFNGNPQQIIQQMLDSGRISQEQYNAAYQMAQRFGKMFGIIK